VHVPGKKCAAKIDNLQPVAREKKMAGYAIERQSLPEKNVIHSAGRIDTDVEPRVFAAAKLVNAVRGDVRRLVKLVRHHRFPKLRVDPKNHVRWSKRRFDVRDANLVLGKIVCKTPGADALIARHPQVFVGDRAVAESNFGSRAIHPGAAKTRPLQRDTTFAAPVFGTSILRTDGEMNNRWTRPFPFAQKFLQLRTDERPQRTRIDRAVNVESEIVRRIEEIGPEFSTLMSNVKIAQPGALPVPRKF